MIKKANIIKVLAMIFVLCVSLGISSEMVCASADETQNVERAAVGWVKDTKGIRWRLETGEFFIPKKDGWYVLGGRRCYLYKNGYQKLGWVTDGSRRYYYSKKDGHMAVGLVSGYYFDQKGVMQTGWKTINGKRYYFSKKNGHMAVGLVSGYYFNSKGVMQTGWKNINGKRYYFSKKDGHMAVGLVSGYYFNSKGVMQTGWKTINGKRYYFSKKNGRMAVGLVSGYYFSSKGVMQTGWKTINGKKYYFNPATGKAYTGWYTDKNTKKKYYFNKNGYVTTGKMRMGSCIYYFNSSGVLKRSIDGKKKMIALTFDDGPAYGTPIVLDVLEKYNAVATFFVVGNRVSTYSSYVKRANNIGCEIGNHTYGHPTLPYCSSSTIQTEISQCSNAVLNVIGKRPVIMRPPGGGVNSTVSANVGLPMILWSVDTLDWRTRNTSQTVSWVLNYASDGAIVLMHDLHISSCYAAQQIVPALINRGYQLVTVSEMAELRKGSLTAGKTYSSFT